MLRNNLKFTAADVKASAVFIKEVFMKRIIFFLPICLAIFIMIVVFYFSAQPAAKSTEMSDPFVVFIMEKIHIGDAEKMADFWQFAVRKSAHFYIYFLLGNMVILSCKNFKLKLYPVFAAVVCLLYAVSDEIHQYFVPGRSCELRDIMIDFCGALLPIIIISLIDYKENKNDRNKCIKNI